MKMPKPSTSFVAALAGYPARLRAPSRLETVSSFLFREGLSGATSRSRMSGSEHS